ncbi:hypothetical protein [Bradyrhizobium cytisi]|uniref:Uncharacterized protein n=1 Tax=Bradyrhizobium cytisi TaxID=515489 RepID=A0A5S4WVI3_9BRAD|nr:hypothetical protein [Bradyrhizobium cytisi]TYL85945.1 hypothetical protein FXB38_10530 [Bradyrhizobium cytisi]
MTRWHPSRDLTRLLEALSGEILAASDEQVRQTSGLQGWTIANTARDVREVIMAAHGDVSGSLNRNCDLSETGAKRRPTRAGRGSLHNWRH